MRILEKENYYNVINGYKDLFIKKRATATTEEEYLDNALFDEIYALYTFDREIRIIHLKYLLQIENYFKTILSHTFSGKYGYDNYLKIDNFDSGATTNNSRLKKIAEQHNLDLTKDIDKIKRISAEENVENVIRLFGDIQQEIARQLSKHNQMVTHYMTQHGYIPLWVLVNVLTFGKVTTFYFNMKEKDKIDIAKQFNIQFVELHKYMSMLGYARNICAHDERFYDIRFSQRLHTKSIKNFNLLHLPRDKSGSYTKGICDAFAIAIIFSQLLSKSDLREFVSLIDSAIKKLSRQLKVISIQEVLDIMGYTKDWKNVLQLSK
jgi:abortive infection bacteriophage resistance protein